MKLINVLKTDHDGRLEVNEENENLLIDSSVSQSVWSEIINNFDMNVFAGTFASAARLRHLWLLKKHFKPKLIVILT